MRFPFLISVHGFTALIIGQFGRFALPAVMGGTGIALQSTQATMDILLPAQEYTNLVWAILQFIKYING